MVFVPKSRPSSGPGPNAAAWERKSGLMGRFAMIALCASLLGAATADAEEAAGEVEARAALADSAWAFVYWRSAAGRAADDFGVEAPALDAGYAYGGEDGALNLVATATADEVRLRLEGSGWRDRTDDAERILTRNAAHEVAHVFQYAVGPALEPQWLHEGFADALAHEAMTARGEARGWGGGLRCAEVLNAEPIQAAQAAGDARALYDCSSIAIRAVAAARGEDVRNFYVAFAAEGGTDAAFLRLAGDGGRAADVTAFLTRDWRHADPAWVIRQLRAGRLG